MLNIDAKWKIRNITQVSKGLNVYVKNAVKYLLLVNANLQPDMENIALWLAVDFQEKNTFVNFVARNSIGCHAKLPQKDMVNFALYLVAKNILV